MHPTRSNSPQQICERFLQHDRATNIEKGILRSEVAVIDRLLARGLELSDAYHELHAKLHDHPPAVEIFLGLLLSAAAFWNPEKMEQARAEREQLAKVNVKIAKKAAELADLLEQRSVLDNTSDFSGNTHYDICAMIEAAAASNHLFRSYVQDDLAALRTRFGLKYWPTLTDILQELATDADAACVQTSNPLTAAGTDGARSSLVDFFKVLFAAIEENSVRNHGRLPRGFHVTDNALASLVNCALDLAPDAMVDDQYVKRLRQRGRENSK